MTDLDHEVITHMLMVDPAAKKPIIQHYQPMGVDRCAVVKEEVDKLLQVGLIEEVHYPF